MIPSFLRLLKKLDWPFVVMILLLTAMGLTIIYSVGVNSNPPDLLKFQKQLLFFCIGLVGFFVFTWIDYRALQTYTWLFYGGIIALLVLVLIFGTEIRGTRGWFVLFGQNILQPIELAKPFVVLILAKWFAGRVHRLHEWSTYVFSFGLMGIPVVLGLLQPDFGSPFLFICVWLGYVLILQTPKKILFSIFGAGIIGASLLWLVVLNPTQKQRIETFLNPGADPLGSGYHVTQSIIAVGSGQWWGRGLGLGSQSQLNFLPEQETDFIFAVIAEELGAVGALLVLIFFGVLFWRMIEIAKHSPDDFGSLFVVGMVILFSVQVIINIGMNVGWMPVTGVPLPLLSAGGSSLLAMDLGLGLVGSVAARRRSHSGS